MPSALPEASRPPAGEKANPGNALRYAPPGSTISLGAIPDEAGVLITVEDEGGGERLIVVQELDRDLARLEAGVRKLEFKRMFRGEMDSHEAFLDIQAGAGGTEAQDWAQMLMRMYIRWAAAPAAPRPRTGRRC